MHESTYPDWSPDDVAIRLNVALRGNVGLETMYAAYPASAVCSIASAAMYAPAATSAAMLSLAWNYLRGMEV